MAQSTLLIIHPGGLGDVLLSLPAIEALRTTFPRHEVGLIAGQRVGALLRECRVVDRLFPTESRVLADLFAGPESVTPELVGWLSCCDLAVCWMADGEQAATASLQQLGARHVVMRSLKNQVDSAVHQSDRILNTIRDHIQVKAGGLPLQLPAHVREAGAQVLRKGSGGIRKPIAVLHAGSGSHHKCCRPELFARVMDRLRHEGVVPVLVKGPADEEATREVARACRHTPVILEPLDLVSLAGVLVQATCVVGHDSGVSHLASALQVPTIVLFGPTDPQRWAPRGRHVTVLTGQGCRCETWGAVQQCEEKPCLRIPTDDVLAACAQAF